MTCSRYAKCEQGLIHLVSSINSEFTLCGDAFEGDTSPYKDEAGFAWKHHSHGPVTCPRCIAQIKACRGIKTITERPKALPGAVSKKDQ